MTIESHTGEMAIVRAQLGQHFDQLVTVMRDVDTFPIFLFSDDRPRLVEARTRAVEVLDAWVVAAPESAQRIYKTLPDYHQTRSVAESLLEAATATDFNDPSIGLFAAPDPRSRVFAAAPHLLPLLDESGLVLIDGLDARPWGLHTHDYAFQYHQLLRRAYGSGIHYGLIDTILRLSAAHGLTARLALDERRVRFKNEYQEVHEFDYWYGRALQEEELDTLSVVGETFHGDPHGGTSLLHPYAGLSVRWKADGPLKVVEIEEFMPAPEADTQWVFARYLHAIRDTKQQAFVHCDGAVKAFAADKYPREASEFKNRGKGDRYRKLFRVDGMFPASAWSELASSWFRGNELVAEYFGREHTS
ncbi:MULTISPECIES: hypothetical protein [unclassified Microbacterium]|uniref:hypothetical protein n=1 Tax=unclassified Microbacterium TaxID=2609290 RepID=UPI0030103411